MTQETARRDGREPGYHGAPANLSAPALVAGYRQTRRQRPLWIAVIGLISFLAFAAGRLSVPAVSGGSPVSGRAAALSSAPLAWLFSARAEADPRLIQAAEPLDPRELIPMQPPGQGDGQAPGQEGEAEQCVLVDGQLFQMPAPGDGQGGDGGTPELIPLVPVPQGPGQQPAPPQQQVPSGPPAGSLRM